MRFPSRRIAAVVAVLAVAGGGAAAYATAGSTTSAKRGAERQAFLNDLAGKLGVSTDTLTADIKASAIDQVDAALAAGNITQAQADAIKARINAGALPGIGGPGFGHRGGFGGGFGHRGPIADVLGAAATYLGISTETLRSDLMTGKSLADVAGETSKSVDGLEQALTAAVKAQLDQAVTAGKLTADQEQQMLDGFNSHVADLVNGKMGQRPDGPPPGGAFGPPRYRPWQTPSTSPKKSSSSSSSPSSSRATA